MSDGKMSCPACGSDWIVKNGFTTNIGAVKQSFICKSCGKRTTKPRKPVFEVPMRESVPQVKRYIITTAQNATPVHKPLWKSILNCADHYDAELIVISGRYRNPTSLWTKNDEGDAWYDEAVLPYLVTGSINLGNHLTILGNVKVQWAASNPLASMEVLTKDKSSIIGHGRLALRSVATPQNKNAKLMYTTGACTTPNYTDTKQGEIARFHHSYGGLIVEVAEDRFHVRQLVAMKNGSFCDINMEFTPEGSYQSMRRPLSLTMGDTHWAKIAPKVYDATFKQMLPELKPHHLVWHDLLDQYARNHHHRGNWVKDYQKHHLEQDDMQKEVHDTLDALKDETPDDCLSVVVSSNHDRALNRWMLESDFRKDPKNAGFFITATKQLIDYMNNNDFKSIDPFILYGRDYLKDHKNIKFLTPDESFVLSGVEHCMHGDIGPNGSRGSTKNLSRIGVKSTKGHNHTAEIIDGCYSVGKSTGKLEYESGPSSHSNTHCLQYYNGKRTLITIIDGKWRL